MTDWHSAWAAALDELEADVAQVEALLVDDHMHRDNPVVNPWSPPEGLGPLPLDLRPRADAVLARQIAATQAVVVALASNRRQAAYAASVQAGGAGAARPAYLDCSA